MPSHRSHHRKHHLEGHHHRKHNRHAELVKEYMLMHPGTPLGVASRIVAGH